MHLTKDSMEPFDGRRGRRLPYEIVGDMRFFGYYIGNETILSGTDWGIKYSIDIVFEPSDALGNIFALYLFRGYGIQPAPQDNSEILGTPYGSTTLIGQYIQSLNDKTEFSIAFDKLKSENENNWRDVIVRFFKDLGSRSLQTAPLRDFRGEEDNDYAYWIITEGGYLERAAALFCNVLRMDKHGNVINEAWARHRTSQYVRLINDNSDTYKPQPAFKEWEMELWM